MSAKTSRIEIGPAVIDRRYENPLYMVETAGASLLHVGLEWRVGALMRYLFLKRRGGIWPARTRAFG